MSGLSSAINWSVVKSVFLTITRCLPAGSIR